MKYYAKDKATGYWWTGERQPVECDTGCPDCSDYSHGNRIRHRWSQWQHMAVAVTLDSYPVGEPTVVVVDSLEDEIETAEELEPRHASSSQLPDRLWGLMTFHATDKLGELTFLPALGDTKAMESDDPNNHYNPDGSVYQPAVADLLTRRVFKTLEEAQGELRSEAFDKRADVGASCYSRGWDTKLAVLFMKPVGVSNCGDVWTYGNVAVVVYQPRYFTPYLPKRVRLSGDAFVDDSNRRVLFEVTGYQTDTAKWRAFTRHAKARGLRWVRQQSLLTPNTQEEDES